MSKVIVALVVAIGLGVASYVFWQRSHPSITPTVAPAHRLAPAGTFFLLRYKSVTTGNGVTGLPPGTRVSLLREADRLMHVTDGHIEFDVPLDDLTNNLDIASRVAIGDARAQEQIRLLLASQSVFVSILQATYGCPGRAIDVTAVLQTRVAQGERRIQAGNDLSGDPASGRVKTLNVTYAIGGGAPVTESIREGASFTIPAPPAVSSETSPRRVTTPGPNPLDRPAYDQKRDVARPPIFRHIPPRKP